MSAAVLDFPAPARVLTVPSAVPSAADLLEQLDAIDALTSDWLYATCGPEGRMKLLRQYGVALAAPLH